MTHPAARWWQHRTTEALIVVAVLVLSAPQWLGWYEYRLGPPLTWRYEVLNSPVPGEPIHLRLTRCNRSTRAFTVSFDRQLVSGDGTFSVPLISSADEAAPSSCVTREGSATSAPLNAKPGSYRLSTVHLVRGRWTVWQITVRSAPFTVRQPELGQPGAP